MRKFLLSLPRCQKRSLMLTFDIFCIWLSLVFALTLRYSSFSWFNDYSFSAKASLLFAAPITCLPFFIRMGLYRAVLRYINSIAFITMLRACAFSSITFIVIDTLFLVHVALPRSVPFIYFTSLTMLTIGSRYFAQRWLVGIKITSSLSSLVHSHHSSLHRTGDRALVYGSRVDVADLLKLLDKTGEYCPVGIISSDSLAHGGEIAGRPVYSPDNIVVSLTRCEPQVILLAMPHLSQAERLKLINRLREYALPIKIVPDWHDIISGRNRIQDVREVNILDVLCREEVKPNDALLSAQIFGKSVMVTGAGGSIGSEIVRQVIRQDPIQVLLVDHCEYNLYIIEKEINDFLVKNKNMSITVIPFLVSVTHQEKMFSILSSHPVQTIYHAAGYKHVPMVESNIQAGIDNNTWGTVVSAQAAIATGVDNFVLISTDKAVRPTSIMGASKRLAEMALQAMSCENELMPLIFSEQGKMTFPDRIRNKTVLSMVRFGNVLDSSGSVIPLFKEQIRQGGPITVTDKEVIRYFMSIPEAAQLVIQAGAMSKGGDVFVLDMGEPIKIDDLAKRMIELSGLTLKSETNPEGDIDIVYTGLRPGEKLYEELLITDNPKITEHTKIFKSHEDFLTWPQLKMHFSLINKALESNDIDSIFLWLSELVHGFEYTHSNIDNNNGELLVTSEVKQSVA